MLRGGNGGNGGKGGDGGRGADVSKLNFFEQLWYDFSDGTGGNGANGGYGGNSGYSLVTGSLYNYTQLIIVPPLAGSEGGVGDGGESNRHPGAPGKFAGEGGELFVLLVKSGIKEGYDFVVK